jgi:hypothetical protein
MSLVAGIGVTWVITLNWFSTSGSSSRLKRERLAGDCFTLGATSEQDKAGFVYNQSAGRLFFDGDGMGGQKQVLVAKLNAGTALTKATWLWWLSFYQSIECQKISEFQQVRSSMWMTHHKSWIKTLGSSVASRLKQHDFHSASRNQVLNSSTTASVQMTRTY